MNKLELEGKWNRIKGAFKQKYGQWFDDEKLFAEGKFDEVLGKLQEKSGKTRQEIEKEIQNWKED
ncbi:CsbD family protein [Myroides sp. LJL119]